MSFDNTQKETDFENCIRTGDQNEVLESPSLIETCVPQKNSPDAHHETPQKISGQLRRFELWLGRVANIETHGAERVLEEDKRPPPLSNSFWIWLGLICNIAALPLGILAAQWGLTISEAAVAVILGSIIGSLLPAYCGTLGSKLGLRAAATSRYSFGLHGSKLICIINLILMLGYNVISAQICGQLLPAAFNYSLSTIIGVVIVSVIAWIVSFFGFAVIHMFEKYSWIIGITLLSVLLAQAAHLIPREAIPFRGHQTPGFTASFISYTTLVTGSCAGWAPIAADYYCHYPAKTPFWKLFVLTVAGLSLPAIYLTIVGHIIGVIIYHNQAHNYRGVYEAHGVGGIVGELYYPTAWSKFSLVMLMLSVIGNTIVNIYSGGLAIQLIGDPFRAVPRFIWSTVTILVTALLAILGRNYLTEIVQNLASILGYITTSFGLILLIEDKWFRRNDGYDLTAWNDRADLPSGLAAVSSMVIAFVSGLSLAARTNWYIGPIATKFGGRGADVALFISIPVTIILYPLLRSVEKKKTGR
ncbi:hypothetical protein FQN57_007212 [Myotisia sp. PD_48]|nr:hypothetical protein FQN57_007212 [Myotisia sp. PD_48]